MLAIDQRRPAVCGFAGGKEKRIAVRAHERIGREHRAHAEGAVPHRTLRHAHDHAAGERLLAAARAALLVVHAVDQRVPHRRPLADLAVNAFVRRRVRQPARPRAFAGHAVGSEKSLHTVVRRRVVASVLRIPRLRSGMARVFCLVARPSLGRRVSAVFVVCAGRLLLGRRLRLWVARGFRWRMIAMPGVLILHLTSPMLAVVLLRRVATGSCCAEPVRSAKISVVASASAAVRRTRDMGSRRINILIP